MRKSALSMGLIGSFLLCAGSAFAGPYRYDGLAHAVLIKNSTGHLFSLGEIVLPKFVDSEQTKASAKLNSHDLLSVTGFRTHSEAFEGKVKSNAKVTGLRVLPGLAALPDLLSADAVASYSSDNPDRKATGRSEFTNLRLLGEPLEVTGALNQKIGVDVLGLGLVNIVLNAHKVDADGSVNHTAIRIDLPTGDQIFIAKAAAGSTWRETAP
jgi:hypothetical protein